MKCAHCGFTGESVALHWVYIGGSGYQLFLYCYDQEACWRRWDEQNLSAIGIKEVESEG